MKNHGNDFTASSQMTRILAIDYGSKRVGIAISDEARQFALPLNVVLNSPDLLKEIVKIAVDNQVKEIVMGESRNYKGEANEILMDILDFKDKLQTKGFLVHLEPEFMSTAQAERIQGKNDKIDASAAAIVLQTYLEKIKFNKK